MFLVTRGLLDIKEGLYISDALNRIDQSTANKLIKIENLEEILYKEQKNIIRIRHGIIRKYKEKNETSTDS